MSAAETASRLTPYAREMLDNPEVQDQLRRGAERLRSAYLRSRKRRIKAARDEKWRRVVLILGLGATGAGVAIVLKGQSEGGQK